MTDEAKFLEEAQATLEHILHPALGCNTPCFANSVCDCRERIAREDGFRQRIVFGKGSKLILVAAVAMLQHNLTRLVSDHPENENESDYTPKDQP